MNDAAQQTPQANPQVKTQPQSQPPVVQIGQKLQGNLVGTTQTQQEQQAQAVSQPDSLQPSPQAVSATEKLQTFESVLDQLENTVPHGVVQAVDQATDTLNPQGVAGRTAKERVDAGGNSLDAAPIDAGGGVQAVETEPNPEIPVEVESYLQRVENHHETAPTEVVIADGTTEQPTNNYPSKPVIVLPITQEEEKEGKWKSPKYSFRWLVEWSHKIVRMFTGKVVYKPEVQEKE